MPFCCTSGFPTAYLEIGENGCPKQQDSSPASQSQPEAAIFYLFCMLGLSVTIFFYGFITKTYSSGKPGYYSCVSLPSLFFPIQNNELYSKLLMTTENKHLFA